MKVSIIIPVYNCEKFIEELLNCLWNQTMKDFEVIFIDDCSEDDTPHLLKEAVSKDKRFSYYRNDTRQGAAISRNKGIEASKASYILCLDADDCYEEDLLEQLISAAYESDADMVMLERNDFYGFDRSTICRSKIIFDDQKKLFEKDCFSVMEQPTDFFLRCENGTPDRMIKRELLEQYQIRFQNLKNSNDVFYILFSTFCAKKIVHTKTQDCLYHRRVHSQQGRISNFRDPMCAYQALQEVHDKLIQYDLWRKYCVYFWIFVLDSLEKQLFVCKDLIRQKEVYEYIQREGLTRLGVCQDEYYKFLPESFQRQFEKFYELPYEQKCFQKSMTLEALCGLYRHKISALLKQVASAPVAFWGVGRMTSVFIKEYHLCGGTIEYIIDNDERKQGSKIDGTLVVSFDEIENQIEYIIVSNRNYYHSILKQVREKNQKIKIRSLEEIIYG